MTINSGESWTRSDRSAQMRQELFNELTAGEQEPTYTVLPDKPSDNDLYNKKACDAVGTERLASIGRVARRLLSVFSAPRQ